MSWRHQRRRAVTILMLRRVDGTGGALVPGSGRCRTDHQCQRRAYEHDGDGRVDPGLAPVIFNERSRRLRGPSMSVAETSPARAQSVSSTRLPILLFRLPGPPSTSDDTSGSQPPRPSASELSCAPTPRSPRRYDDAGEGEAMSSAHCRGLGGNVPPDESRLGQCHGSTTRRPNLLGRHGCARVHRVPIVGRRGGWWTRIPPIRVQAVSARPGAVGDRGWPN